MKIRQLEHDLDNRLNYVKHLQSVIEKVESTVGDCVCAIDLESIKPFSIERGFRDGYEQTIYGYYRDGKVKMLCFLCSREKHEELAKEFREYLSGKSK